MLDLTTVDWINDRITRDFVARNREKLEHPESMPAARLGEAVTYCRTIENPFAEEMLRRSGHLERLREALSDRERSDVFRACCKYHGIFMG